MDIDLPIEGLRLRGNDEHLWLSSASPLRVLSSAVVGDELTHSRHVLSVRVPLSYDGRVPEGDLIAYAGRLGVKEPFVGLLTAVDLGKAVVIADWEAGVSLSVIVTVGVRNATAAGRVSPGGTVAGTINIVLVVDAELTAGALVSAVITATEAKTLALLDQGVRTVDGEQASGTSSDAIVVAHTGRGPRLRYAGPATLVGLLIGRTVRGAVRRRLEEKS